MKTISTISTKDMTHEEWLQARKDMILFRPPYGDYNDTLIRVCRESDSVGCGTVRYS